MKKKSPYKFSTHLNDFGETVVYLHKGNIKVWLFNIHDGIIGFDVGGLNHKKELESVDLKVEEDDNHEIIPAITGVSLNNKALIERLEHLEDILHKVFRL